MRVLGAHISVYRTWQAHEAHKDDLGKWTNKEYCQMPMVLDLRKVMQHKVPIDDVRETYG